MTSKKILIAEDNDLNLKLMKDVLLYKGYEVVSVENGEDVIEILKDNYFDLLILDIQMPKKSGYEVLAELKTNIPILIVSACASPDDIERVKKFKYVDYMTKPLQINLFVDKVQSSLTN